MGDSIPVKHAEFFWNAEFRQAPSKLVVVDERSRIIPGSDGIRDQGPYEHLSSSLGAHSGSWMDEGSPNGTPEGIFASLWLDRSADRASIKAGLKQLSKIEECAWARRMLAALEKLDVERAG